MSQAELQIVISPEGKVQIEVQGVQGPGCKDLTRFLEESLGEIEQRDLKAEYYLQSTSQSGYQNQQY